MKQRSRIGGSPIKMSLYGPDFVQSAGCIQFRRATSSTVYLGFSTHFYYKFFSDIYYMSVWKIVLHPSNIAVATPKQWIGLEIRERKSHRQILNLKYIFGTEICKSKDLQIQISKSFTHFPTDQVPSLQYYHLQPLCFLGSPEDEETECPSVTSSLQV